MYGSIPEGKRKALERMAEGKAGIFIGRPCFNDCIFVSVRVCFTLEPQEIYTTKVGAAILADA